MITRIVVLVLAIACSLPTHSAAQGALMLAGGGAEGADADSSSWSWQPYSWLATQAGAGGPNGGNGRIAVVDTVPYPQCGQPDGGYCAYFESAGAAEAVALHVSRSCTGPPCLDADDPATYDAVLAFDGLFFRGGDQSEYVGNWASSELERAVFDVFSAGGALGGTSAGAMILSSVTSAGDATSFEATADPYHPRIDLVESLLGGATALGPPAIVDTHFTTRARLGRLAVFVGRWAADAGVAPLGIGIDQETALTVDSSGIGTVYGQGAVSFIQATPATESALVAGRPPFLSHLRVDQLTEGFAYDLGSRSIVTIPADAEAAGPLPPDPSYGRATLRGSRPAHARMGESWARWRTDLDLFEGTLRRARGRGVLDRGVSSPLIEDDSDLREVRVGGPQWLLATDLQHGLALYLDGFDGDEYNRVRVRSDEKLVMLPPADSPEESALILDCYGMEWTAQSSWDPDGNGRARQSVALTPCKLHLLNSQLGKKSYDALEHSPR